MPNSWTALAVALLAVVPGFIATTTWARARTWKGPSGDLQTVLQSLALSGAIQVVISPLTVAWIVPIRTRLADHSGRVAVWLLLAVLVLPVGLGLLVGRLTDVIFRPAGLDVERPTWLQRGIAAVARAPVPPTAWDWLFANRPPDGKFVLVEFKDGSRIGGVFEKGSVALTSPEPHGLFLTKEWVLDEDANFIAELPGSNGVLIAGTDEVRWVRILGSEEEGGELG